MKNDSPRVTFFGDVGSVTGSNFLLEASGKRILVDCGLFQGFPEAHKENVASFPYDPDSIDILFITHAHMDHIGRIPKLVKEGFAGVIYSTPVTKRLARFMLQDALRVMEFQSKETGEAPFYSSADMERSFSLWQELPYHKSLSLTPDLKVIFKDAGHILGSAMVCFSENGGDLVFTGDLGNSPSLLLRDTEAISGAKYLVMESTYGNRNHESKTERRQKFKNIIEESVARSGALVIPAFSLERTQTILYELNELIENKEIKSVPVFLDSPLAIRLTDIYEDITKHYNEKVKADIASGDKIFDFPRLKETAKVWESQKIAKTANPKIIIAGSGMSSGGRVLSHEAHYLPDSASTILLIGYQSLGTLGRRLEEGAREVEIDGRKIPVRARIVKIEGYSSHKDSDHLIEFVEQTAETLKQVFVVMGEPKASLFLVQRLRDYLGVNALYPERGKTYKLDL